MSKICKHAYVKRTCRICSLEAENAELQEENHKCQMREEKYSKQAQRAFDKADTTQEHCDYMNDANAALIRNADALKEYIKQESEVAHFNWSGTDSDDRQDQYGMYQAYDDVLDKMKQLEAGSK